MAEKIEIPEEKLAEFREVLQGSTYWNEAELTPRQVKHIVDVLAPRIAQYGAYLGWERGFDDGEADVFNHDERGWDEDCIKNPFYDPERTATHG
jgi:hypothetical protein